MIPNRYTALILAGDRGPDDPVAISAGVKRKALAEVAEKPMLEHVIEAVSASQAVGRILIVANQVKDINSWARSSPLAERDDITYLEGASSPVASVEKAIQEAEASFPLIVLGADCPLIRATDIDAFLAAAKASDGAEILVALAPETLFRQRFSSVPRTFVRLGKEGYSGCNMFALQTAEIGSALRFWRKIESERKKALRLVAAFGLWSLVRVLLGRMDLEGAFERMSEVIGVTVKPYLTDNPLLAMDVDAPVHLAIVDECLAKRKDEAGGL
jgi:GTP:adenosylcobinamide-phosphate guanylyltransferase